MADSAQGTAPATTPAQLARLVGISARSLVRVLRDLVGAGLVEIVSAGGGRGRRSSYRVFPEGKTLTQGQCFVQNTDTGDGICAPGGDPSPPHPPILAVASSVVEDSTTPRGGFWEGERGRTTERTHTTRALGNDPVPSPPTPAPLSAARAVPLVLYVFRVEFQALFHSAPRLVPGKDLKLARGLPPCNEDRLRAMVRRFLMSGDPVYVRDRSFGRFCFFYNDLLARVASEEATLRRSVPAPPRRPTARPQLTDGTAAALPNDLGDVASRILAKMQTTTPPPFHVEHSEGP